MLIAAAADLGDDGWCSQDGGALRDRIANSLGLGLGGPVGSAIAPGALLFARPPLRDAPLARLGPARLGARPRPWSAHVGPDGARVLFAGELQDREALLARLPAAPAGKGDDALYAAALAHLGSECDRFINGPYAAIAWYPDERRLRLVRAPLDAPPLHYWQDEKRIVAASTPRAAIAAGADPAVDEEQLADALFLNFRDARRGWFRGIHRVAAGEIVEIGPGGVTRRQYWKVEDLPAVRFARDSDYVDAVEHAMRRALRETAAEFDRPAVQLSGGQDSQAVASFALKELPRNTPLKAYCWVPQDGYQALPWPGAHGDETAHASAFAAMHPAVDLELVDTGDLPLDHHEESFFLLAGLAPMSAGNMHWGHDILRRAAAAGHGVVLDGHYGNNGFSYDGLTGPATWLRQGRPGLAWREVKQRGGKGSDARRFLGQAVMPHLPIRLRAKLRGMRGRALDPFDSWCPMRRDYAERAGVLERSASTGHDPLFLDLASSREWRAATLAGGQGDGADTRLALELLHGVPMRSPLAYRPLFELTAGIPDEQYLRDGETRWLARRLLKGRVPEQVRTERRLGIQSSDWPVRWRREREAIMAELERLSSDPAVADMLDLPRLQRWMRECSGENSVGGLESARIFCAAGRGLTAARYLRFQARGNG
ncbi:asparagine synthase family protein [Croceicoccus marinus]|uniref:asparagine synthase (glutamine-hydrolyzing) n=1 Tax=Croceicoccus marinus TaxID=450378 RepID=A0A7G6VRB3_9SPHN|nr:asparagine synthetase B family protein [Croceicoccus marinus]QNE04278.1 asparagine synthase [Croceicoccus marinus]